ncbi:putative membrane protein YdfK [Lonepinella sp. MS14435]
MTMPIGPFVNGSAVLLGGLLGAFMGVKLPERVRASLNPLFGLTSAGLGIMAIPGVKYYAAVVLASVLGLAIGEWLYLEKGINKGAGKLRGVVDKIFPPVQGLSPDEFVEKFVAILVLFCASGTGVFGSMNEGMTGDPSILYIKTILDFFTAGIFAITLGYAVSTIAIPQLAIQLTLFFLATLIVPLTTPEMRADFAACGGLIMLATGFRIMGIKSFPVANMLPGLILVMPISHLWATYIAN